MSALANLTRTDFETLLDDKAVIEIMANPSGDVFVERFGEGIALEGRVAATTVEVIIRQLATRQDQEAGVTLPIISGEIGAGGHRIEGLLPPVVDAPAFSIRRRASQLFRLASYVERGALSKDDFARLLNLVRDRRNIIVAGGTSTGKTTFLNALLAEVEEAEPEVRQIIIEDTREIQTNAPNTVFLKKSEHMSAHHLLMSSLRQRPDRIHVGEVRDGVALTLLKAWNTGHPGGFASIHANSAPDAITRLGQLIAEVSVQNQDAVIASAVDAVVFLKKGRNGPVVSQIEDLSMKKIK